MKDRAAIINALGEKELGQCFEVPAFLSKQEGVFDDLIKQLAFNISEATIRSGMVPVKDSLKFKYQQASGIYGDHDTVMTKLRAAYSSDPMAFVIFLTHRMLEAEGKIASARADSEYWQKETAEVRSAAASSRTMKQFKAKLKAIEDAKNPPYHEDEPWPLD